MKAMEYAQMMQEAREESAALEDSQLLVGEAIRSLDVYSLHRKFFEKVITIVERNCQTGSYKRTVTLENGKEATHRFSWAVAMMHGGTMEKYKNQFDAPAPEWVMRRHPYQIHLLCDLAIESRIQLPELSFGYFSPIEADKLRALRSEANYMLVGEIRKIYNRDWLDSLREQLAHARQMQSSL